jgi:NhaA family Na+:H+ antiporter
VERLPPDEIVLRPWSSSDRAVPRSVVQPIQQFLHTEAAGGIALAVATVAALVWANVDAGSYADFWSTQLTLDVGSWTLSDDLGHLVNDGLMALFFFVLRHRPRGQAGARGRRAR